MILFILLKIRSENNTDIASRKVSQFRNGYPCWLEEEIKARKKEVAIYNKPAFIDIGFVTPAGDVKSYRYYLKDFKSGLMLEDFSQAVRFLEDRHAILLPKSGFLREMVEYLDDADFETIKQCISRNAKKRSNESNKK